MQEKAKIFLSMVVGPCEGCRWTTHYGSILTKASALELQLKSNMEKLLRDRAAVVGLDELATQISSSYLDDIQQVIQLFFVLK